MNKIIFDMDGTLINTALAAVSACHEQAKVFGLPKAEPNRILELIGIPNPQFYLDMYPDWPRETILKFGRAVEAAESELILKIGLRMAFSGVPQMLADLQHQGHCLYVASSGTPEHVRVGLAAAGLTDYFTQIHCNRPKADMVANIIEDTPKTACAMVGDRIHDIIAASKNGIPSWGAAFGYALEKDFPFFNDVFYTCEALTRFAAVTLN